MSEQPNPSGRVASGAVDEQRLACDMTAIPPEHRAGHQARIEHLFKKAARETRELPDGYAWRFASEDYPDVVTFVANERRCCPFLTFTLSLAPHGGSLWLHLTGRDAIKDFLQSELGV